MNRYQLNRALTGIDDRYLTMVDRKTEEAQTMRQKNIKSKKIFRTILIAAVITALMGITAYAVSSIHAARQQTLRADLKIDENEVSGYTEYAESEPDTAPVSSLAETVGAEPRIQSGCVFQCFSGTGGDGPKLFLRQYGHRIQLYRIKRKNPGKLLVHCRARRGRDRKKLCTPNPVYGGARGGTYGGDELTERPAG